VAALRQYSAKTALKSGGIKPCFFIINIIMIFEKYVNGQKIASLRFFHPKLSYSGIKRGTAYR
jgi:hypothetical protein